MCATFVGLWALGYYRHCFARGWIDGYFHFYAVSCCGHVNLAAFEFQDRRIPPGPPYGLFTEITAIEEASEAWPRLHFELTPRGFVSEVPLWLLVAVSAMTLLIAAKGSLRFTTRSLLWTLTVAAILLGASVASIR